MSTSIPQNLYPWSVCAGALLVGAVGCSAVSESPTQAENLGSVEQANAPPYTCTAIRRGSAGNVFDAKIVTDSTNPSAAKQAYGGSTLITTGSSSTQTTRALLGFDLSPIPAGRYILSAMLRMQKAKAIGLGSAIDVHLATQPWTEAKVTWNTFGNAISPTLQSSFDPNLIGAGNIVSADLTNALRAWHGGVSPNYGVVLEQVGAAPGLGVITNFVSSESSALFSRPFLDVCYSPASCSDGIQNNDETGVDCGGLGCAPCNGLCAGVMCPASDDCHVGACDPNSGACSQTQAPDGTFCDDGTGCTQLDLCSAGLCEGALPLGGQACDTGLLGACQQGLTACAADVVTCDPVSFPYPETCNFVDDDCNGAVDDGNPEGGVACDTGSLGVCQPGVTACLNGSVSCVGTTQSSAEACNDLDDDCDGAVDEDGVCCGDGVLSGDEAGVDCGGSCPNACLPSCIDGLLNQGETGVDCGGPCCPCALAVTAGAGTSCVRLASGDVKCWGNNDEGQLGVGDTSARGDGVGEMGGALPTVDLGTGRTATSVAVGEVAFGPSHACAILDDDTLKCWGLNLVGQLGQGDANSRGDQPSELGDSLPPVNLGTGRHAVAVRPGGHHTCALLDDASVKCWGGNWAGQLGVAIHLAGSPPPRGDGPGEMGDMLDAVALNDLHQSIALDVQVGEAFTCAVLVDHTLKCWGDNGSGQLGRGNTQSYGGFPHQMGLDLSPVSLGAGRTVESLALGSSFACAILDNAKVKCWGHNDHGQLGLGDTQNRGDGGGEMGDALPYVDLGTGRTAVAIAAGGDTACALLDDGSLKCWGELSSHGDASPRGDQPGEMGDNLTAVNLGAGRTAVSIAVGSKHACAFLDNAQIKCWGDNASGQLGLGDAQVRGDGPGEMGDALPGVVVQDGGSCPPDPGSPSCSDDLQNQGELGLDCGGPCVPCAQQVTMGAGTACAVFGSGQAKCWGGYNSYFVAAGAHGNGDMLARGTGPCEMGDNLPLLDLGAGHTVKEIATFWHTCAVLDDDSVKCWGPGNYGPLGLGDTANRGDGPGEMGDNLPSVALGTGRTALTVRVGAWQSCALLDDHSVKCWGNNSRGQLGQGDATDRGDGPSEMGDNLPPIALGTGRTALDIGVYHLLACALLDDHSVKCWGANSYGQLGQGDTNDRGDDPNEMGDNLAPIDLGAGRTAKAIGVGFEHVCAILDNDRVKCWGNGYGGTLGSGDTTPRGDDPNEMGDALPYVDLGAGRTATSVSGTCALLDDLTLKCWGPVAFYGDADYLGQVDWHGDEPGEMGDALPAVDLGTGRHAVSVSIPGGVGCAVLDNGRIKCWGHNQIYGALGTGDTEPRGDDPNEMGDFLPYVDLGGDPNAGVCVPPEVCNGVDDDGDGLVDEDNPGSGKNCDSGMPSNCAPGLTACSGGQIVCEQIDTSGCCVVPELCNGLDDDCDGVADDGNPGGGAACDTGVAGKCAFGATTCSTGQIACVQSVFPSAETCNGDDDDCDGVGDVLACTSPSTTLLVAEGAFGDPGQLFTIDITTGTVTPVGAVGFGLTGMATAFGGQIYATESGGGGHLLLIDPQTGAGASLGLLDNGEDHTTIPDLTFRGSRLFGWSMEGPQLVTLTTTGTVTPAMTLGLGGYGNGLAADRDGVLVWSPDGTSGHLYKLNPVTGAFTQGPLMDGTLGALSAMTFLGGELYAVETDRGNAAQLVTINTTTGHVTPIMALPAGADALTTLGWYP